MPSVSHIGRQTRFNSESAQKEARKKSKQDNVRQ